MVKSCVPLDAAVQAPEIAAASNVDEEARSQEFSQTSIEPGRADEIPPEIVRIVHRMIEKNPADRYANANELIEDLRRAFRSRAEKDALEKYMYIPTTSGREPESQAVPAGRKGVFVAALLGAAGKLRPTGGVMDSMA